MEEDNSLINKKEDSYTTNTKPSDNDKLGNLPIIKQPLESIIHDPSSSSNPSDNIRRTLPQHLIDQANRKMHQRSDYYPRNSSRHQSSYINELNQEKKKQYIQAKLDAIKFTATINQGHGLPFPDQQQQQTPFGLLCRGLTS